MSIDSQISEMRAMAQTQGLNVVCELQESHSAKDSGQRPMYNKLLIGPYSSSSTAVGSPSTSQITNVNLSTSMSQLVGENDFIKITINNEEITQEEIYTKLKPELLISNDIMTQNSKDLIELNKERMERDNISVALIRTF